jgi:hypothetical protein
MNEDRALALALRQQQLLARSAALRGQVAWEMGPWKHRLGQADQVRAAVGSGWQWLRRHPEVPAGVAVGLVVLRPARAWRWGWRWGRRAWLGWQLYRRLIVGGPTVQPTASPAASLARMVIDLTRR